MDAHSDSPPPLRKRTRRAERTPDSQLAIRWFTPRGRAALAELLEDLRHGEGTHAARIVADLRRPGAEGPLDLRGIDLRGIEFANAQLPGADLRGARLAGTNLMRANLQGAQLERAVFRGARLCGANLQGAVLERADLREVDLSDANLEGAKLKGAKMRGAELKRTWAKDVDFTQAFAEDVDLSFVRTKAYQAPKSTVRLRTGIGAPPYSEPVPTTQRFRTRRIQPPAPLAAPAAKGPAGTPILRPRRAMGGPPSPTLDAALAELLLRRPEVDRIVVSWGGVEHVLFEREGGSLRAAG